MLLVKAQEIVYEYERGFRISFHRFEGKELILDFIPDLTEPAFKTKEEAEELIYRFYIATQSTYEFYNLQIIDQNQKRISTIFNPDRGVEVMFKAQENQ